MDDAVKKAETQADKNELLCWATARGLLADTMELLTQGADPKAPDKNGLLPVHFAAAHGHLDILQFLASKGTDLEAEDPKGRQPLHHAVLGQHGDVVKYLAAKSAWLEAQDYRDDTPLHLAARLGWQAGCQALLAAGAKLGTRNKRQLTPLGEALAAGHTDAAEGLLKAGADPCVTTDGFTLLHVVAGLGRTDAAALLLQRKGVDVNAADGADGATPLHAAALSGSTAMVQLLVKHGADPGAASRDGLQPRQLITDDMPAADALRKLLHTKKAPAAAAAAAAASKGSVVGAAGSPTKQQQQAAAGAAGGPKERYAAAFKQLGAEEQRRRVEGLSRLSLGELETMEVLRDDAKEALFMVHRRRQLLGAFAAVAALRADGAFQEDAGEARVRAALQDIQTSRSTEAYQSDSAVVSVMAKLAKLQSVLRENGAMKVGLDQLLLPPGQTLDQVKAGDQVKVKELEGQLEQAVQAAVAAITGQVNAAAAAGARPRIPRVSQEIEELEDEDGPHANGSTAAAAQGHAEDPNDLLAQATAAAGQQRSAASGKELEERVRGTFAQELRRAFLESSWQAIKSLLMIAALYGVLWWLGLLPGQQDPALLEQRLQQMAAAAAGQQQQPQEGQALNPTPQEE